MARSPKHIVRRLLTMVSALALVSATLILVPQAGLADPSDSDPLETVVVVGNSPVPGTGVDKDKVPGNVQTISAKDIQHSSPDNLSQAVSDHLASVSLSSEEGSPDQQDLDFRGFTASPIFGEAQGLAVYQNGVRMNEAFGDTVNWDLIPQFAVDRLTLQGSNPVFGLNALGGAVALEMKNGFNFSGGEITGTVGSFGKIEGTAEYGKRVGDYGIYVGTSVESDDGYRQHSPSTLRRTYADLGAEGDRASLHLAFSGAWNDVRAAGPTPVQLLNQDLTSIFTYPQRYDNQDHMVEATGNYQINDDWAATDIAYYRHFQQAITDGNTTDATPCTDNAAFLCLGGNDLSTADLLYDSTGNPVATPNLNADQALGEIDDSFTRTDTVGDTLQLARSSALFGHDNNLVAGASLDHSRTVYSTVSTLGVLQPNLLVSSLGISIDQSFNPTASEIIQPVSLDATNNYYGLYLSDTFDLTPKLSLTFNGRYNLALIALNDRTGTAPTLTGQDRYARFNPGAGLTYQLLPDVTGYVSYSEANRAPTPGELGCSSQTLPCALGAFLVSDPPLSQVVSRTVETGLRGHFSIGALPGRFQWNADLFRTENSNDIILVTTQVSGFGYFQNAGQTRRQGFEGSLSYQQKRLSLSASYSLIDATYRTAETLGSSSPSADANGLIYVQRGDTLPLTPRHRVTLSADYALTDRWSIGGDLRAQSGMFLAGDDSNQQPQLAGYYALNLRSAWQLRKWLQLSGEIDNITGEQYDSYGAFTQLDGLPAAYDNLSDPRTYSPSPPRAFYASLEATF